MGAQDPRHLGEQVDAAKGKGGCEHAVLQHGVESVHQANLDDWEDRQVKLVGEAVKARAAPSGGPLNLQVELLLRERQLHCLLLVDTEVRHVAGEIREVLKVWAKWGTGTERLRQFLSCTTVL